MSEQPPQTWLERLLAAESEQAIPDNLDLWPGISQRLRERGAVGSPLFGANGAVDSRDLGTMLGEGRALPSAAGARRRSREFIGAAITFGFAAMVVALFAIVTGRPEFISGELGLGNGVPETIMPPTPPTSESRLAEIKPVQIAGPDCTVDLDVTLRSGTDNVTANVRARSSWGCANTGALRLRIVDRDGKQAAIAGNPLTLPLTPEGQVRRADTAVVWSNWCGERRRFWIETSFGDEQRRHSLPEAPPCADQQRPSNLRMSAKGAASATPEMPIRRGTPIP